ncbi:MAG TPA: putative baseplate assembly protein [Candidatus Binatia bacterium]|nr:putative baseplate assembly protein [Candidatus Binatia bacterium]
MKVQPRGPGDERDAARFVDALAVRRAGYVEGWRPAERTPGAALGWIAARYLEAIVQRLNQAPAKNELAFFDLLDLQLVAAQAARVPVVFKLADQVPSGAAPAGTGVAAPPPPGSSEQIAFETEQATGVTAGKLIEVVSLWPGRDEYVDHSTAFLAGAPITLFARAQLEPTPHHLYLAHETLLALAGTVEIGVAFELTHGGGEPLGILWEYWDGAVWRGFRPDSGGSGEGALDGTAGLTASGRFRLRTDCAQAARTVVDGVKSFWLRGRLTEPLPPDPQTGLPEVESIRLTSVVDRPLTAVLRAGEPYDVVHLKEIFVAPTFCGVVRNEAGDPIEGVLVAVTDPEDADLGRHTATTTGGASAGLFSTNAPVDRRYEVAASLGEIEATVRLPEAPSAEHPRVDLTLVVSGLPLDEAFADATPLDVSKPFYPFGLQPQPGSTFYFTNAEVFSKPGAGVRIYLPLTTGPQDAVAVTAGGAEEPRAIPRTIAWEYWNGRQWVPFAQSSPSRRSALDLGITGTIDVTIPEDMAPTKVNDHENLWMRARLVSGGFGFTQKVVWIGEAGRNEFTYVVTRPPILADARLGYRWQHGPVPAEQVFTYNDFQYADRTYEARWPGSTFLPFERIRDVTPALYLGFDRKPPVDRIGLYVDVVEVPGETAGPALVWEYWDGAVWRPLSVDDETQQLRLPGIVAFIAADDSQPLARFAAALHWVRARLKEDGPPGEPTIAGIFPNAVWAAARRTLTDVPLGASLGTPNQVLDVTQTPILVGEYIEVRELAGPRANVEWRIVATAVAGGSPALVRELEALLGREGPQLDVVAGDVRLRRDRHRNVVEAWVRWTARPHLYFSGPEDRHYVIDRVRGRVRFGDGVSGKIPPAGAAVLARRLQVGGGSVANVAAGQVTQLLGVVPGVQAVFNPRAAEGGADRETLEAFAVRAPATLRHRGRAVTPADYETLAREASPAVAFVRAVPTVSAAGLPLPGWVTLLIVPRSREPRPWPSFGLRRHVQRFILERAAADLPAGHIHVTGPRYFAVDVAATLAPRDPSEAGIVERRARERLMAFLHPLGGGPAGDGWTLGRDVFLSDVAAVLERVEGVDYVEELALLLGGVPQGERIAVAEDRIVVAGTLRLKIIGAER